MTIISWFLRPWGLKVCLQNWHGTNVNTDALCFCHLWFPRPALLWATKPHPLSGHFNITSATPILFFLQCFLSSFLHTSKSSASLLSSTKLHDWLRCKSLSSLSNETPLPCFTAFSYTLSAFSALDSHHSFLALSAVVLARALKRWHSTFKFWSLVNFFNLT